MVNQIKKRTKKEADNFLNFYFVWSPSASSGFFVDEVCLERWKFYPC